MRMRATLITPEYFGV
ncbi:uncharacterized protein FFMR_08819 [Fusarium fujikuroi]|nr:uncharacterized protein FFMR_08819 [Fusarium fujikuroi]